MNKKVYLNPKCDVITLSARYTILSASNFSVSKKNVDEDSSQWINDGQDLD